MHSIALRLALLFAFAQLLCASAELEIELPRNDGLLKWNAKERKFTAALESLPLKAVMAKLSAATGWKVLIDPAAEATVSATFTNRASGEALRLMLGGLNFAVVPEKDAASKLLVYRKAAADATELVQPTKDKRGKDWIKNEALVTLRKGSKQNIEELAKMLGAKIIGRNDATRTYRLRFDSDQAAENARTRLASQPDLRVDDNYYVRAPDDSGARGPGGPPVFNLKPDGILDGAHTIIAVVDTAVQPITGDKSAFLLPQINVAGAPDPAKLASDVPLHGTSMVETLFGSMAVTAGDQDVLDVRVLPVNVYGDREVTTSFDVFNGVYVAVRSGADIVSMSLGGDGDSELLDDLISQARSQRGTLFFAAAGNTPTTEPTFPAANPLVFAVTAGDQYGNYAPYANRGSFIDLMAPGTSYMDYNGRTYRITGTSPATAIVAGAAATYVANGMGVNQTVQRLQQTFGMSRPR